MTRKIRILIAKPGLDGHDRGAKVVARACRDAQMEVIYTGLHCTPEQIAEIALQEDVDAIGMSILSGAHKSLAPRVISQVQSRGLDQIVYIIGGIIPQGDIPFLKEAGIHGVFGPMTPLAEITTFIQQKFTEQKGG